MKIPLHVGAPVDAIICKIVEVDIALCAEPELRYAQLQRTDWYFTSGCAADG